ncbi:MAG: type IV toxin-antitoxin system AbiEi family antitoxin [Candidatus Altiarchaeota archaeon]|nr:type IV toxin-antitoxin system AbiEi family antitoxin [Candidatus Altiarchaeota archaeon]
MKLKIQMSHTEQTAYFSLLKNGIVVVNAKILSSTLRIPEKRAMNLLVALSRKGVMQRIAKGQYALIPADVLYDRKGFVNDPYIISDQLMDNLREKYYISYQSAAHLHGAAEQLPFTAFIAVLKQRRPINVGNKRIQFITLKKDKFFGISEMKYFESFLKVSDREKTIIDLINRPDICGGMDEVVRTVSNLMEDIDIKKFIRYLKKMKTPVVAQRSGFILEKLKQDEDVLKKIEGLKSPYTYLLDPYSPERGKKSGRWNLIENMMLRV